MASDDQSSQADIFLLPDLGEGLEDAELMEWRVKVGQQVDDLDILATVETAKAAVDVASPRAGVIAQLHGNPGDTIKVGAPFVTFSGALSASGRITAQPPAQSASSVKPAKDLPDSEKPAAPSESSSSAAAPADAGTTKQALAGAFAPPKSASVKPPQDDPDAAIVGFITQEDDSAMAGKVKAAPAVRRLAADMGVNIRQITGTGTGGRITARDVHAAAAKLSPDDTLQPPVSPASPIFTPEPEKVSPLAPAIPSVVSPDDILWPSDQESGLPPRRISTLHRRETPPIPAGKESLRIPLRGVRRIIAQHLRHSIGHAVHFTIMDDADITALDEQRRRFTEIAREKVTLLPFIAAAVCRVLSGRDDPKFNRLNATVDDDNHQIIQHRTVHLGIATDTEEGLMVPVIKDADKLGVLDMGRRIRDLAKKARERQIKRSELVGSTFTISNFGSLHGKYGTPIINYPEACILAVGRAREGVVVRNHMIGVGLMLPLSLSADHRVVDGGTAAQALARIIELLQNPAELLQPGK